MNKITQSGALIRAVSPARSGATGYIATNRDWRQKTLNSERMRTI
ncbi:hypothetical protein [Marivita sp. S6314]|nr:hypothetical protein [Marivita sp. S6314]